MTSDAVSVPELPKVVKLTKQEVLEAASIFKKIDAAKFRIAELAKITEPTAFGFIEGGKKEGEPVGAKVSLDFESHSELSAFKAYLTGILEQRLARFRNRLAELYIDAGEDDV